MGYHDNSWEVWVNWVEILAPLRIWLFIVKYLTLGVGGVIRAKPERRHMVKLCKQRWPRFNFVHAAKWYSFKETFYSPRISGRQCKQNKEEKQAVVLTSCRVLCSTKWEFGNEAKEGPTVLASSWRSTLAKLRLTGIYAEGYSVARLVMPLSPEGGHGGQNKWQ
jgi:hypothetical protein